MLCLADLDVFDAVEVELSVHVGQQRQPRPWVALLEHPRVLGVEVGELEAPAAQTREPVEFAPFVA